MSQANMIFCDKFSGKSKEFDLFETQFRSLLQINGIIDYIYKEKNEINSDPIKVINEREDAFAVRVKQDQANNKLAYAYLVSKIPLKAIDMINEEATDNCREALKILRKHYKGSSRFHKMQLMCNLTSLEMKHNESAHEYVLRAEKSRMKLKGLGEYISDTLLIHFMVNGLPKNKGFETFTTMLCSVDFPEWNMEKFR